MSDQSRSYQPIRKSDLERLARIARSDRHDFFARHSDLRDLYEDRFLCVALCQGAALHYIDGSTGVKDFDVWSFFARHPARPMPARRRKERDFGISRFGTSPDRSIFVGRKVDLMFRSIPWAPGEDPIQAIQQYLTSSKTASSAFLAAKAVVVIDPPPVLGVVAWPLQPEVGQQSERPAPGVWGRLVSWLWG